MTSRIHQGFRGSADLALAAYLDELVADRRVLWMGNVQGGGPERLAQRARTVHVLDPAAEDRETKQGRMTIARHRRGPLAFRPGSFDVIVIPELLAVEGNRVETLVDIRRTLAERGVVVAGSPTDGELEYEELFELLSGGFDAVQMLGQAPLQGWLVVDFAAATPDSPVTFDGSLAESSAPEPVRWYAVCGRQRVAVDPYAVIQVPAEPGAAQEITSIERPRGRTADRGIEASVPGVPSPAPVAAAPAPAARVAELEKRVREQKEEIDAANTHAEELEAELSRARAEIEQARAAIATATIQLEAARREAAELREPPAESFDDDYGRLEASLRDAGRRAAELQGEVERRALLVRDLVEELKEAKKNGAGESRTTEPAADDDPRILAALTRAQQAEAVRAEAVFRADELGGQLAFERRAYEGITRREAELTGQVRGMRARLAEVEEYRELAEGRLALAQEDLAAASDRILALERELAETREQLEIELVRARGEGGRSPESGEFALDADRLQEERDLARAEALRLTALVTTLEHEALGKKRGYEARIAELTVDSQIEVERARREVASMRGEVDGLRLRLADREAALAALGDRAGIRADDIEGRLREVEGARTSALDQADALRAEIAALRAQHHEGVLRGSQAEERLAEESARAASLATTLAARDALITRLQMDLADREQAVRALDQRLTAITREAERLREAVVAASDAVEQRDRLEKRVADLAVSAQASEALELRVAELEKQLAEAKRRTAAAHEARTASTAVLRDVREALAGMAATFESAPAIRREGEPTAVGMEVPEGVLSGPPPAGENEAVELAGLRDRIDQLLRDAADQEMLMRSLAAQLEERDDRIVALQQRLEGGGREASQEDLQRELMELQERVARLSEELLHEREARRMIEEEAQNNIRRAEHETEVRRLHELLGDRDAEVLLMQGKVQSAERDARTMREAFAQARGSLEDLLGAATSTGDPATAERIGSLLRLFSRF